MRPAMPLLLRGNARSLPLADASVDLIVTSPPYFGLRDYGHADQLGSEPTPAEFLDALLEATAEMIRVLKPSGSLFVNLGDSYASRSEGSPRGARDKVHQPAVRPRSGVTPKCLFGMPWRYAIRCVDELGLVLRQELIWSKSNGLPESVTDRTRRSHEQWFHFTTQRHYFAAVDEIREPHAPPSGGRGAVSNGHREQVPNGNRNAGISGVRPESNPLGKLPGSVWSIATQPLNVPEHIIHAECCGGRPVEGCTDGVDHYAAFPMAWPYRIIRGWCPLEVCTACGEGRQPVVDKRNTVVATSTRKRSFILPGDDGLRESGLCGRERTDTVQDVRITSYACGCPDTTAPSTPGVVLDPFAGTNTTALVAAMLGRTGIGVELSSKYRRIAQWRASDAKERARAAGLDPDKVAAITRPSLGQVDMFDLLAEDGAPA